MIICTMRTSADIHARTCKLAQAAWQLISRPASHATPLSAICMHACSARSQGKNGFRDRYIPPLWCFDLSQQAAMAGSMITGSGPDAGWHGGRQKEAGWLVVRWLPARPCRLQQHAARSRARQKGPPRPLMRAAERARTEEQPSLLFL
jgi:hypothetical protein